MKAAAPVPTVAEIRQEHAACVGSEIGQYRLGWARTQVLLEEISTLQRRLYEAGRWQERGLKLLERVVAAERSGILGSEISAFIDSVETIKVLAAAAANGRKR